MTEYRITPAEFLREVGAPFTTGGKWLTFKICPFCDGGASGDRMTFSVHAADGNYSCFRTKCGAAGSFWKLIEFYGRNPRDYRAGSPAQKQWTKRSKVSARKKFLYGKS